MYGMLLSLYRSESDYEALTASPRSNCPMSRSRMYSEDANKLRGSTVGGAPLGTGGGFGGASFPTPPPPAAAAALVSAVATEGPK